MEIEEFFYSEPQESEFDMHYSLELGVVREGTGRQPHTPGSVRFGFVVLFFP